MKPEIKKQGGGGICFPQKNQLFSRCKTKIQYFQTNETRNMAAVPASQKEPVISSASCPFRGRLVGAWSEKQNCLKIVVPGACRIVDIEVKVAPQSGFGQGDPTSTHIGRPTAEIMDH